MSGTSHSPRSADPQFLDGHLLAGHMGLLDRPFIVDFDQHATPWSAREDRFTPSGLARFWADRAKRHSDLVNPDYPLGLYIHVPFCTHLCSFCRCFRVRLSSDRDFLDRYVDFLAAQMEFFGPVLKGTPVRYFSVGGGTPSILSPRQLARVFDALYGNFDVHRDNPMTTFEMSFPTMHDDTLRTLVDHGVRRISVGVQTLDPAIRKANHMFGIPPDRLARKVERAQGLGIHCNLDLILGLAEEAPERFLDHFRRLVEMGPSSVIVNILADDFFRRITPSDASDDRSRMDEYLKVVGEGMAEVASLHGYQPYAHADTIEAILFLSPRFEKDVMDNRDVMKRLASGIHSVEVGTSIFAFGTLCDLALVPNYLLGCYEQDMVFDPDREMYQICQDEVYGILYPKDDQCFIDEEMAVAARVRDALAALDPAGEVEVGLSARCLSLETADAGQESGKARVHVTPRDDATPAFKHVGTFDLRYQGVLTGTTRRLLALVGRHLVREIRHQAADAR